MSPLFEVLLAFSKTPVFWLLIVLLIVSIWAQRKMPVWRGAWGERSVNKMLAQLGTEYTVYHDVYIPNGERGLTQLDHLVVSPYGLHVIETKHYSGWIFGNERQKYWTQVIYKNKQRFYNPVRQDYGHIQALKSYLEESELPAYSIIAFSESAELKFKEPFTDARVVHFKQLLQTVKEQADKVLSAGQIATITAELTKLTALSRQEAAQIKKEHIQQVKAKQKVSEGTREKKPDRKITSQTNNESAGNCPKCGGKLIRKKGRYGPFLGCETFPACRYTAKVETVEE